MTHYVLLLKPCCHAASRLSRLTAKRLGTHTVAATPVKEHSWRWTEWWCSAESSVQPRVPRMLKQCSFRYIKKKKKNTIAANYLAFSKHWKHKCWTFDQPRLRIFLSVLQFGLKTGYLIFISTYCPKDYLCPLSLLTKEVVWYHWNCIVSGINFTSDGLLKWRSETVMSICPSIYLKTH